MAYNDAFTKMVGDTSATFKTEITAVQDNVTDEIGAPVLEGGKYKAEGDLNEIIQEIINNDVLLKAIADKLRVDLDGHANNKNNPHTTTKGQVGLGNVENYIVTSSVSDPSNTKYATAGAVKSVNDNANTKLPKSGGTTTGTIISTAEKALEINSDIYKVLTSHRRYNRTGITAMGVEGTEGQYKGVYHILLKNDSGDIVKKFEVKDDGIYEDGHRMYSPINKPTPSNIGAVSKTGDTMSNPLSIDTANGSIKIIHQGVEKGIIGKYTPSRDAVGIKNTPKNTFLELDEGSNLKYKTNSGEVFTVNSSGSIYSKGNINIDGLANIKGDVRCDSAYRIKFPEGYRWAIGSDGTGFTIGTSDTRMRINSPIYSSSTVGGAIIPVADQGNDYTFYQLKRGGVEGQIAMGAFPEGFQPAIITNHSGKQGILTVSKSGMAVVKGDDTDAGTTRYVMSCRTGSPLKILGDYITSGTHTIPNLDGYKDRLLMLMPSNSPSQRNGVPLCIPVQIILSNLGYEYRMPDPVGGSNHEIKITFSSATSITVVRAGTETNDSLYRAYLV